MPSSATVTIPLDEWDEEKNRRVTAENEAAALRKQLVDLKLESGDPKITKALTELSRKLLDGVRFAIAQMPPEATKGWPAESLREAVALLPMLPDYSTDDSDLAREIKAFAAECDRYALLRSGPRVTVIQQPEG
jgi:hypothetical protein